MSKYVPIIYFGEISLSLAHPGIHNFLEVLRKKAHLTKAQVEQREAGHVQPPPKKN